MFRRNLELLIKNKNRRYHILISATILILFSPKDNPMNIDLIQLPGLI